MGSHPANRRVASSDPIEQFARKVGPIVRKETLVVVNVGGYQPLLPLLGRFNGTPPIPLDGEARLRWYSELSNAHWVVMPVNPQWKNVKVLSGEVPGGRLSKMVQLALYHVGDENSPSKTDLRNLYRRRINGVNSSSQVNEDSATTQSTTRPARTPRRNVRAAPRAR
jgi:hypothetical protein